MVKHLRFSRIDLVERKGALLLVWFLDDEGNPYNWAPKWADVEQIFLKTINVERFNKPESQFLNKFAGTAQKVVEGAQRIDSCYKLRGGFGEYRDGKLVIMDQGKHELITPAFDITLDFLDSWLESYIEVLVVNDMAIRMREYYEDGIREYPESADEDLKPDELPFQ